MKVFVFKPSNDLIGKFEIQNLEELEVKFQNFAASRPVLAYDYLECAESVWTVVSLNSGLGLQSGRVYSPTQKNRPSLPQIEANTQCQIYHEGRENGPYAPEQIRAMWSTGALTSDAYVLPHGYSEWMLVGDFLSKAQTIWEPSNQGASSLVPIGIMLIAAGVAMALYFATAYETSVKSERTYVSGVGFVGGEYVVNLGLQQNRLIGVLVGVALSVSGLVVSLVPKKAK